MAEFVAKEFAHAGAMRIANVRIGHLDEPSARFSTTTAEAVDFIASVVHETEEEDPAQLDWNDEGCTDHDPCCRPSSLTEPRLSHRWRCVAGSGASRR